MAWYMGIDIGSATTKGVIAEDGKLRQHHVLPSGANYGLAAGRLWEELLNKAGIPPDSIDEQTVADHLFTNTLPEPDLVIRTSGEMRMSNFLLWQAAYAELYFCQVLWPDFGPEDLEAAIKEYARRERRFGGVNAVEDRSQLSTSRTAG